MRRTDPITFVLLPAAAWAAPAWAADYLSVAEAQRALFPQATAFADHAVTLTREQRQRIKALSGVAQRADAQAAWRVRAGDAWLGWFLVDEVIGKHEFITYAVALAPEGRVLGVEILSYRETHGGQVRDEAWRRSFVGKTLEDRFKLDEDVPNLSGATLSCRNVMNGVKRLLALQKVALPHE